MGPHPNELGRRAGQHPNDRCHCVRTPCEDFFDVIDIDHDGSIDVEDFVKFFATADRGVRVKTVKKPIARAKVQAAPLKMDHVRAEVAPAAAIDGSVVNGDGDEEEVEKPMKLPTLDDDALRLIFPKLLQDGAEEISKDAFVSLVMLRYVVLQRTALVQQASGVLDTRNRQPCGSLSGRALSHTRAGMQGVSLGSPSAYLGSSLHSSSPWLAQGPRPALFVRARERR